MVLALMLKIKQYSTVIAYLSAAACVCSSLLLRLSEQLYVSMFDVIRAQRLLTKETVCSLRSKNVLSLFLSPCAMMKLSEKQFSVRRTEMLHIQSAVICPTF